MDGTANAVSEIQWGNGHQTGSNQMNKHEVTTAEMALVYITDCTLATIETMAMTKRKSKYEFRRQKGIAQTAIDWIVAMGIPYQGTRIVAVVRAGSVDVWAERQLVTANREGDRTSTPSPR